MGRLGLDSSTPHPLSSLGQTNPIPSTFLHLYVKFFNSLVIFLSLCWTLFSFLMYFLKWQNQKQTQIFPVRPAKWRVGWDNHILWSAGYLCTSSDQGAAGPCCWLMLSSLSCKGLQRTPDSSHYSWSAGSLALPCPTAVSIPGAGFSTYLFSTSCSCCSVFQPVEVSLNGCFSIQHICLSSQYDVIQKLGEGAFNPTVLTGYSVLSECYWIFSGTNTGSQRTPPLTSCQFDSEPFTTSPWAQEFNPFSTQSVVYLSSPCITSLPPSTLGKIRWNAVLKSREMRFTTLLVYEQLVSV